jgi:asparagine synthase (glutamine-hydrolysing)
MQDLFRSRAAQTRPFMKADAVLSNFDRAGRFSRKTWGLMSLEIWHQTFHDQASQIKASTTLLN